MVNKIDEVRKRIGTFKLLEKAIYRLTNKNTINTKNAWRSAKTGIQLQLVCWQQTWTIKMNSNYLQHDIITFTNVESRLSSHSIHNVVKHA